MTPGQTLSIVFDVIAIIVLLVLIFKKSLWADCYFKKYLIGVTAVYLSGALFVTLITFIAAAIPLQFVIISEFSIVFMFVMSFYTVLRLADNLEAIKGEIRNKNGVKDEEIDN